MGELIKTREGKDVLNLELIDCFSTKIHIAMFNEEAYKWIIFVRENEVYKISGDKSSITEAKSRYVASPF